MKPSARVASLFILLFFISFNGFQAYLIAERISETKTKFGAACMAALASTMSDYNKLKAIDSTSTPTHASITYTTPFSSTVTDTVEPAFIEMILNTKAFRTIDLRLLDSIFQKTLVSKKINAAYRLDTITMPGRRFDRQQLQTLWMKKQRKEYYYSTTPMRMP